MAQEIAYRKKISIKPTWSSNNGKELAWLYSAANTVDDDLGFRKSWLWFASSIHRHGCDSDVNPGKLEWHFSVLSEQS